MIFLRSPLMQGRVEPEDDFADLGGVPVDDSAFDDLSADAPPARAPDLSMAGDVGKRAQPETITSSRPDGQVETGRVRRTLVLPEMTGLERPGDAMGTATEVEDREVRPQTGFERFVDDTSRAQGAYMPDVANAFGLEMPTGQSASNATRPNAPGESQSLSDRFSAFVPTARMAPGTESQSDERTRAGLLALGTSNPVIAPWLAELQGVNDLVHGGDYSEGRDRASAQFGRASEQAPGATLAGSAPNILGLMLAGGPTASTTLGRIGQMGAVGGALGYNQGLGADDAHGLDALGSAQLHGAGGALMAAGGQALGEGAARIPGLLSRLFNRGADEAGSIAAADMLRARGLPTNAQPNTAFGRQVQRMGGEQALADALDAQGVGGRFPTPASSARDAEALLARGGAQLDDVHQQMAQAGGGGVDVRDTLAGLGRLRDELAATPTGPALDSSRSVDRELIQPLLRSSVPEELAIDEAGAIADQAAPLSPDDAEPLAFDAAHRLRQEFDRMSNWRNANPAEGSLMDAAREARGSLSSAMSQAAENLSPETRAAWQQGNQRYSLGSVLRDYARPQGSQLPGAVVEGAAQSIGGRFLGRAAGGAVSNYGPALRGRSLQMLIPVLRALGGVAARFAPILEQAAARSPAALAGTHFILSQTNPQYRQAVEQAEEQQGQMQ